MNQLTKKIILFLSCLLSSVAIIAEGAPVSTVSKVSSSLQGGYVPSNMQLVKDFCPPVEYLVRNPAKQTWSAPGGWKTNTASFLHTLDAFAGAQWVGVGIGEVICIYVKTTRNSFPVTLQRGKLVPAPQISATWSADKGGYVECKSNNVENCPFFSQIPKPPENIYDQLDFYKGLPTESN